MQPIKVDAPACQSSVNVTIASKVNARNRNGHVFQSCFATKLFGFPVL